MDRYARIAAEALGHALENPIEAKDLEIPPDPKLGDFAFPCFKLAKALRKAPPVIAKELAEKTRPHLHAGSGLEVFSTGPYVNFNVGRDQAATTLLSEILAGPGNGTYGQLTPKSRGRWVLEYSSPNIAKSFMVAHLRSTALGAALARAGAYRGFDVIRINHLGDWGLQFGKLTVAYQLYKNEIPAEPQISDLVAIYVKFHDEAEKSPELEDRAREAFAKLEKGDPEITAVWKRFVEISLKEFNRVYERLGVEFDHYWGESFYKDQLDPLLEDLKMRGLLEESEGALIVRVTDSEGREIPPCLLQKKDGASIYGTRDVAAAIYRYNQFKFDRMSYVVGGEQKLHFQQVFGVLRRMGFEWADRLEHISYGLYRFKSGKMSTRKGNFVTLDEVLDETKQRVRERIEARAASSDRETLAETAQLSEAQLDAVAEAVAIGAVVFNDLSNDPVRDVEFDAERITDFEGETGPYLQYAHTRCVSILRKARERGELRTEWPEFRSELLPQLKTAEEIQLVKVLGRFPHHLDRVLEYSKANQLTNYLVDVTKAFGAFYRECRVLGEAPEMTGARLMLVEATRRILALGLSTIGIPLPERM